MVRAVARVGHVMWEVLGGNMLVVRGRSSGKDGLSLDLLTNLNGRL